MGLLHEIGPKSDIQDRVKIPRSDTQKFLSNVEWKKVKFIPLVSNAILPHGIFSCDIYHSVQRVPLVNVCVVIKNVNIRQNILKKTGRYICKIKQYGIVNVDKYITTRCIVMNK